VLLCAQVEDHCAADYQMFLKHQSVVIQARVTCKVYFWAKSEMILSEW